MFLVKVAEREFYLPTEFCLMDGVPDSVRKGPGMRDALAKTRIDPAEKNQTHSVNGQNSARVESDEGLELGR